MKKIVKVMVVLSSILLLSACSFSKKEDTTKASTAESTTKTTTTDTAKKETKPTSPITNEYLTDLSTEVGQYWFEDASFSGKDVTDLNNVTWKEADRTQCFTMLSKEEALFATMENGNIVNARIYKVGAIDENGFYSLTQAESIVSKTYFDTKVKHQESYENLEKVNFSHTDPNESYLFSKSNFSKRVQHVRFYNVNGTLYRENFSNGEKLALHRYAK